MAGKTTSKAGGKGSAKTSKAKTSKKKSTKETPEQRRGRIAELAYLKWLSQTGGQHPISDEQTRQNWLEAERELDGE